MCIRDRFVDDEFQDVFPDGSGPANAVNDYFFTANQTRVVVDNQLSSVFSGFGSSSTFNNRQSWSGGTLDAGTESFEFDVAESATGALWTLFFEITL